MVLLCALGKKAGEVAKFPSAYSYQALHLNLRIIIVTPLGGNAMAYFEVDLHNVEPWWAGQLNSQEIAQLFLPGKLGQYAVCPHPLSRPAPP